jgi:hypothetical protein
MFDEYIRQALIRQFHDDDQFAIDRLDAIHRQEKRMAERLDALNRVQFLNGRCRVAVLKIAFIRDEFDGFIQPAGRFALPDFAEAAAS